MREGIKVMLGVLALTIGASAPTLIIEAISYRAIYQVDHPRDWNIKGSDQKPTRRDTQNEAPNPVTPRTEEIGSRIAQGHTAEGIKQSKQNNSNHQPSWVALAQGLSAIAGLIIAGVIGIINFAQWSVYRRQAVIMQRQLAIARTGARTAQTNANAAMLQARTLIAAEAAEILVHSINLVEFPDPPPGSPDTVIRGGPVPEFCRILLSVFNSGRTRGEILRTSLHWGVFAADPSDNPPFYPAIVGRTYVILRDQLLSMKWGEGVVHLDETLRNGVNSGEMTLWVYGFFTYQNFLGQTTDVGFIAHWRAVIKGIAPQPLGFIMEGPPQYNYVRRGDIPTNGTKKR